MLAAASAEMHGWLGFHLRHCLREVVMIEQGMFRPFITEGDTVVKCRNPRLYSGPHADCKSFQRINQSVADVSALFRRGIPLHAVKRRNANGIGRLPCLAV